MDIVLNTVFANSALPKVTYPGFADSFNRVDGALDYTDDGKAWIITSATGSGTPSFVRSSGAAKLGTGSPSAFALVDAGASDGVLTCTINSTGSPKNIVLVFRYVDSSNYFYITLDNGSGQYRCYIYKDGAIFDSLFNSSVTSTDGDVIAISLSGSTINVTRNGTALASLTNTTFQTATKFGILSYSTNEPRGKVDSIQFVAAT